MYVTDVRRKSVLAVSSSSCKVLGQVAKSRIFFPQFFSLDLKAVLLYLITQFRLFCCGNN
jgi:hypothetical protein